MSDDKPIPVDDSADAIDAIREAPEVTETADEPVSETPQALTTTDKAEIISPRDERAADLLGKAAKKTAKRLGLDDDDAGIANDSIGELGRLGLEASSGTRFWLRFGFAGAAFAIIVIPAIFAALSDED